VSDAGGLERCNYSLQIPANRWSEPEQLHPLCNQAKADIFQEKPPWLA